MKGKATTILEAMEKYWPEYSNPHKAVITFTPKNLQALLYCMKTRGATEEEFINVVENYRRVYGR